MNKNKKYILGAFSIALLSVLSGCGESEKGASSEVNFLSQAPVAIIDGISQDNEMIILNGSSSYDTDGTIVKWVWQTNDRVGIESSSPISKISWVAPGTYVVKLNVYDNDGMRDEAVTTFTVAPSSPKPVYVPKPTPPVKPPKPTEPPITEDPIEPPEDPTEPPTPVKPPKPTEPKNLPPIADAGDTKSITSGESVTLDGSRSSDPDGNIVKYEWSNEATGISAEGESVTINSLPEGAHVFILKVTDDRGATDDDMTTVSVATKPINNPPVARTDGDTGLEVFVGETKTLSVSGVKSTDDGKIMPLTYLWEMSNLNGGDGLVIDNATSQNASISISCNNNVPIKECISTESGTNICNFEIQLTVNDGEFSSTDKAGITIGYSCHNRPPLS